MKKMLFTISLLISMAVAISATPSPIVGTWESSDGETLLLEENGKMTFSQKRSVNGAPGEMTSTGTYTYDSANQKLSYTIEKTKLMNSAGYDDTKKYDSPGRSFVETAIVKGNRLYWANREYVDSGKAEDNTTKPSDSADIDSLITHCKEIKGRMDTGDADALNEFQDLSARLMAMSDSFSDEQLERFMQIVTQ